MGLINLFWGNAEIAGLIALTLFAFLDLIKPSNLDLCASTPSDQFNRLYYNFHISYSVTTAGRDKLLNANEAT